VSRIRRWSVAAVPYLLLSLAVLSWAGNWVIGRGMRHEIGPVAMAFCRWSLALVLLLPVCWHELRTKWPVVQRNWWRLALLGVIGAMAFNTMIYTGLQYSPNTNTTLFNSIVPVYIVVISWLAFGERISLRQGIGIAVSAFGVLIIISQGDLSTLRQMRFNVGQIWVLVAMLLWAIYTVLLRWRPRELSASAFLASMLLLSLPALLPFYGWELYSRGGFALSLSTVATMAYFATVPSVFAYLLWNRGVAQVGANRAGLMAHLLPIFTVALSVVFLGEQVYAFHFAGALCVFSGIALMSGKSA
jgi:drug/metabolite transporter (DMT)-like permease